MRQGKGAPESLTRDFDIGCDRAATEKIARSGQMSKILHSGGANAVKNILRQMGSEATEESTNYFLNYVANLAANHPGKVQPTKAPRALRAARSAAVVFGTAGAVGSSGNRYGRYECR